MSNLQHCRIDRNYGPHCRQLGLATLLSVVLCAVASAKDIPLTGVLLYGTGSNIAYVQVTGFLMNGKTELRSCTGAGPIDKSTYKSLTKVPLSSVKSLERLPNGSMVAAIGDAPPSCVVPSNFKFEKENSLTLAEYAEKSIYTGTVSGSSSGGQTTLPPFAIGAKIVFGSPSDKELAEYLLADRIHDITSFKKYLTSYPTAAHATAAKTDLAALLVTDGQSSLARYKTSTTSPTPDFDSLKHASDRAADSIAVLPGSAQASALRDAVRAELKLLSDTAAAKLSTFQDATKARKPGISLLLSAKDLSDHISAIDPRYSPGLSLATAINTEMHSLDTLVQTANAQIKANQFDDAYSTIGKYRSFADEEPRLKQIVETTYKFHLDKGNQEIAAASWKNAVVDLKAAVEIAPIDSAKASLARAEAGLIAANNKDAADRAMRISTQRMDDGNTIGAYDILSELTPDQQHLVSDRMTELRDPFVEAATKKAKELQDAHSPIHGRADEDAMRQAYEYLARASKLSDNSEIGLKQELMADTISKYYVDEATKYLGKPLSSGVGIAWAFLDEAAQYRPAMDSIRDAKTSTAAAYKMRARLSISVLFRDPTSRRVSAGFVDQFADQLQQAFAAGLGDSGLPVQVILPSTSAMLDPNFQFVGEILQHRPIRDEKKVSLQSHYRSGSREIPNEEWNKADQEYEGYLLNLDKAKSALAAAQVKSNKKAIDAANDDINAVQDKVQRARAKLNSIPKTVSNDVIYPYNYTQTTLNLTNIVELSVRTIDANGATVGEPIRVIKGDKPRHFVILGNIKADDTEGLKEIDAQPDENQLMTDVEIEARDAILKAAVERVKLLPERILSQARHKAEVNDIDGAGEAYVLYLNCTAADTTPSRTEAITYLNKNFNIRNTLNLHSSAQ